MAKLEFDIIEADSQEDPQWWIDYKNSPGCHQIGCHHAFVQQCGNPMDGFDYDCGCEGFVSENACIKTYEKYCDYGAKDCRLYQITVLGKRYPDVE